MGLPRVNWFRAVVSIAVFVGFLVFFEYVRVEWVFEYLVIVGSFEGLFFYWGGRDAKARKVELNVLDELAVTVLAGTVAVRGWPPAAPVGERVPVGRWVRGRIGVVQVLVVGDGGALDVEVALCLREGQGWRLHDSGSAVLGVPGARPEGGGPVGVSARREFRLDGEGVTVHSVVGFARADVTRLRVDYADRSRDCVEVEAGSGFFVAAWTSPGVTRVVVLSGDEDLSVDLPGSL